MSGNMGEVRIHPREVMSDMTLTVLVHPSLFGWWNWRLRVAGLLCRLAACVLRCRFEFKVDGEPEGGA